MIVFRLVNLTDKESVLKNVVNLNSQSNSYTYILDSNLLKGIPGSPFAYWISDTLREKFNSLGALGDIGDGAKQGLATADDFRFVRNWWEVSTKQINHKWLPFAKGGSYAKYYLDINLVVNWENDGNEIKNFANIETGEIRSRPQNLDYSFRPGLTWSDRTTSLFSARIWPSGGIFSIKGSAGFFGDSNIGMLGVMNSRAFNYLLSMMVGAADSAAKSYQVGTLNKVPVPKTDESFDKLVLDAYFLTRRLDRNNELSHFFTLPKAVLKAKGIDDESSLKKQVNDIDSSIEKYCFALYGFTPQDKKTVDQLMPSRVLFKDTGWNSVDELAELLSWAAGMTFGRFEDKDSLLDSTDEVSDIFSSLPTKSKAMKENQSNTTSIISNEELSESVFHLIELYKLEYNELNLNNYFRDDFFSKHLSQYSKSRRQAPIYWPLQTASGSYTLWVYYHRLNSQTLYSCVNDFVEPKLALVTEDLNALSNRSNRSSTDEKELTKLTDLQNELKDFRDELLRLAKIWKPNLNDGVQITAAPLWKLFQHTAWQKKLKETWEKLEEGEYDWAHLAASIWPDRVLRKCHQDRSIAIAHDVEDLFWQEVEVPVMRGKKPTGKTKLEWQPIPACETTLNDMVNEAKARLQ